MYDRGGGNGGAGGAIAPPTFWEMKKQRRIKKILLPLFNKYNFKKRIK